MAFTWCWSASAKIEDGRRSYFTRTPTVGGAKGEEAGSAAAAAQHKPKNRKIRVVMSPSILGTHDHPASGRIGSVETPHSGASCFPGPPGVAAPDGLFSFTRVT